MTRLNIVMFFWDADGQSLRSESRGIATRRLFSTDFLLAMASNHSSMTYKLELLLNRRVHNLLTMCLSTRTYWVGPKFHSLLSTHDGHLSLRSRVLSACAYYLLTRLYGMPRNDKSYTILICINFVTCLLCTCVCYNE